MLHVDGYRPRYFEVEATINTGKPIGGLKANAYVVFDYQSPTDFKFAGVDVSSDKLEIGYRDASGWHVMAQSNARLKPDTDYRLLVAVNGLTVTVVVDGKDVFNLAYEPRVDADGFTHGLNEGLIGLGANNSIARIDDVVVQVLRPETTFEDVESFDDGVADFFAPPSDGSWSIDNGRYVVDALNEQGFAVAGYDFVLNGESLLELETDLTTEGLAGLMFDRTDSQRFKFAALSVADDQVIVGHYTERTGIVVDAVVDVALDSGDIHTLGVSLKGSTVSVSVDGQEQLGYVFNGLNVDGGFGLLSFSTTTAFDSATMRTSDPALAGLGSGENLTATAVGPGGQAAQSSGEDLNDATLDAMLVAATQRMRPYLSPEELAQLDGIDIELAELGGAVLARWTGNTILIDTDAAGHGWFVDTTPLIDEEYHLVDDSSRLLADVGSDAGEQVDLLSAVMHEIGHATGREHQDDGLMATALDEGERRLPEYDAVATAAPVSSALSVDALLRLDPFMAITYQPLQPTTNRHSDQRDHRWSRLFNTKSGTFDDAAKEAVDETVALWQPLAAIDWLLGDDDVLPSLADGDRPLIEWE